MSIIQFNDDFYARIAKSMKVLGRDIAWLFCYPDGWDRHGGLDKHVNALVTDWARTNFASWKVRYADEAAHLRTPRLNLNIKAYPSTLHFYKALRILEYNCTAEQDWNDSLEKLRRLIDYLADKIITAHTNIDSISYTQISA